MHCINEKCKTNYEACMGYRDNDKIEQTPIYCIECGLIKNKKEKSNLINLLTFNCTKCNINPASHGFKWPPIYCFKCSDIYNSIFRDNNMKHSSCLIRVPAINTDDNKSIDRRCIICFKTASCQKQGDIVKLYCCKCSKNLNQTSNDVKKILNTTTKQCEIKDCNKNAVFNYPDKPNYIRCKLHKTDEMTKSKHSYCINIKCDKLATFGKDNKKLYCNTHKIGMKDITDMVHKKCMIDDCNTRSSYGDTTNKLYYCNIHNTNNYPKLISEYHKCKEKDCNLKACFNLQSETKGLYCKNHKKPDMIDVIHLKCIVCHKKRPSFNYITERALYCKDCKKNNMVNVSFPKCILCLTNNAIYAYDNVSSKKPYPVYCTECCPINDEMNLIIIKK